MTAPARLPRCPHCGCDLIQVDGGKMPWASCTACYASGPQVEDNTHAEAIAAFTRPAHAVAEVERLRKALKRAVERIRCAACKPGVGICSNHVDEFDMKHTYLPALAAQGGGT